MDNYPLLNSNLNDIESVWPRMKHFALRYRQTFSGTWHRNVMCEYIYIQSCREFHGISEYTISWLKMLIDTNDMLKITGLTIFSRGIYHENKNEA